MSSKNIGTCPACFASVSVNAKGFVMRHGWSEIGGRKVGVYGQAYHVGACYGVGYEPFEVSFKGTVDFFWNVIVPAGKRVLADIARLATFPDFICKGEGRGIRNYAEFGYNIFYPPYEVKLARGETVDVKLIGSMVQTFSYYREYESRNQKAQQSFSGICADAHRLCDAVANWKPGKVSAPAPKKVQLQHAVGNAGRFTVCGSRIYALMGGRQLKQVSANEHVTCPDCLARLENAA